MSELLAKTAPTLSFASSYLHANGFRHVGYAQTGQSAYLAQSENFVAVAMVDRVRVGNPADNVVTAAIGYSVFKKDQRVICNGYDGTIVKVCDGQLTGMVEVRVPGGLVCVCAIELARFNDEKFRA